MLVLGALLLTVAPSGSPAPSPAAAGTIAHVGPASGGASSPGALNVTKSLLATISQKTRSIESTLVLANSTVLSGNESSFSNTDPAQAVFDSRHDTILVAGSSGGISVVLPRDGAVVATWPTHAPHPFLFSPKVMAYDSGRGEIFVSGASNLSNSSAYDLVVLNDTDGHIVTTVPFSRPFGGLSFSAMVYDKAHGEIFAVASDSEVLVINDTTYAVLGDLTLPGALHGLAYDPAQGEVFVGRAGPRPQGYGNVSVINDTNDSVVASIAVGSFPRAIVFDPATDNLFVANGGANNLSVISGATNTVVSTVPLPFSPLDETLDPLHHVLDVTLSRSNESSGYYGEIDAVSDSNLTVGARVGVGASPVSPCFDRVSGLVFVLNAGSANMSAVSYATHSVWFSVDLGGSPQWLTFDSGAGKLYAADGNAAGPSGNGSIWVISTALDRVIGKIRTDTIPQPPVYDPGRGEIFVFGEFSNVVQVFSDHTDALVANVTSNYAAQLYLGGENAGAYDSAKNAVYLTDDLFSNVAEISDINNSLSNTIPLSNCPSGPAGIAYDGNRGELFVACPRDNVVVVINDTTDSVVATINMTSPTDIAYDGADGRVVASVPGGIAIISDTTDTNTSFLSVPFGWVEGVAVDTKVNEILAVDPVSNTLEVFSASTLAHLASLHLPGAFLFPGLEFPVGVAVNPGTGEAFVANTPQGSVSTMVTGFPVTFQERGLPTGSRWTVGSESAVYRSNVTAGASGRIRFVEPAGPIGFVVDPPGGFGVARVEGPSVSSAHLANVTGPTAITIQFGRLEPVSFNETVVRGWPGLIPGTMWWVNFTAVGKTVPPPIAGEGQFTASVDLVLPAGSQYMITIGAPGVYRASPVHFTIVVPNHPFTKPILFKFLTAKVVFTKTGLPPGLNWTVHVWGNDSAGDYWNLTLVEASAHVFRLPSGNYSFQIDDVGVHDPTPSSGTFTVSYPASTVVAVGWS
jgi:DNA-binding beta-propeller fold protein YncE